MRTRLTLFSLLTSGLLAGAGSLVACGGGGGGDGEPSAEPDALAEPDGGADAEPAAQPDGVEPEGAGDGTEPEPGPAEDIEEPTGDVPEPAPEPIDPDAFFPYALERGQTISEAPFPNDLLRDGEGHIDLAPLGDDVHWKDMGREHLLANYDGYIAARTAFGVTGSVVMFPGAAPDMASFEGQGWFVSLAGPDEGRQVPARSVFNPTLGALSFAPAYGHWLAPGATYALLVADGVKMDDGRTIEAPAGWLELLADEGEGEARAAYAGLRDYLAGTDDVYVVGTVFTTASEIERAEALFDAIDGFALTPPTRGLRWESEGESWLMAEPVEGQEALDAFFGIPTGAWVDNPGKWGEGSRADAGVLDGTGEPYAGGSLHKKIGRVLGGTFRAPALGWKADGITQEPLPWVDGKPTWAVEAAVPFTLYLCEDHLADPSDLPVAVFTHGGTGTRHDAVSFANLNCELGIATICFDLRFHSGRTTMEFLEDEDLRVPVGEDTYNDYTGLSAEDEGFVPDHVGDAGGATETVGGLFALKYEGDPEIVAVNLLSIAAETYTLVRYVKEGDWSSVQEGLSFDADNVFHESLSFGTTFTTVLMAARDEFRGVISSVGTGSILTENLTVAPANAALATGILVPTLGLGTPAFELIAAPWMDPMLAMTQWLLERGDSMPYAPHVLRWRQDETEQSIIASGDSWDETLYTPAQLGFHHAYALPEFASGAEFTLDESVYGASTVEYLPLNEPASGNLVIGDSHHTAAAFYFHKSCHAQVLRPVCRREFSAPQPPSTPLAEHDVFESPICAWHQQAHDFLESLLDGDGWGAVKAPGGTCAELYGVD